MPLDILEQISRNTQPGPDFVASADAPPVTDPAVRLIAYYLPQFHAIPENDAWWGEGFTEWTNVTKAVPRYAGHYQPRLPGALGFYDLRSVDTLRRQAAMARKFGISGFCFHHYWFSGRRLLETPLDLLLQNPDIDLPFCINWANENWTRKWDGAAESILMGQDYSPEDDIAFARSLEPLIRDPRYIRVNGRPLLMLYRPGLLPKAAETVKRWRAHFRDAGLGDPYIVLPQQSDDDDPRPYGMDAAAGFPPHKAGFQTPRMAHAFRRLDPEFAGDIRSYDRMVAGTLAERPEGFRLLPGVCPQWDNEARRPGQGVSFAGSTPAKYGGWLAAACEQAMSAPDPDERIVFINAWNEWAEGAYLEPDRHYGYAYLAETAQVLRDLSAPERLAERRRQLAADLNTDPPAISAKVAGRLRKMANKVADLADVVAKKLRTT